MIYAIVLWLALLLVSANARTSLTTNTTFYVSSSTAQSTIDRITNTYDLSGYTAIIQSDGTPIFGGLHFAPLTGNGYLVFDGGGGSISAVDGNAIDSHGAISQSITLRNARLSTYGSGPCTKGGSCGWCIIAQNIAHFVISTGIRITGCTNAALAAVAPGAIVQLAPMESPGLIISGYVRWVFEATNGGQILYSDKHVVVTLQAPKVSAIALAWGGIIQLPTPNGAIPGVSIAGMAQGACYYIANFGAVYRNGTFPCTSPGHILNAGIYQ